jgi:hypothetical protein
MESLELNSRLASREIDSTFPPPQIAMRGVAEMTDAPAESANPHDAMRDFIKTWYRGGADAPLFVEFLLGLTPGEQDEFMAGNDEVWLAMKTPERLQRFDAIMTQLLLTWRQQRADEIRRAFAHDRGLPSIGGNGHHPEEGFGTKDHRER